jgi:hypothetical protein
MKNIEFKIEKNFFRLVMRVQNDVVMKVEH